MRLKRLEIKGFKSFANETVINFNEDVIGIVGPNGSGKSNVVDAVRWVLGEQKSKELRLEKMSNIIFNGTKTKKKGGLAQVSLTFENTKNLLPTEYTTVTISRLLYRTGESEYRLNNVPCRLKDITSLFLDTGIGSNSYAIIALGMVDDLLTDKDDSRRKMFEQAAGISKYKKRKKETLNKLKNTTADLDRVEDLLFEIEANLKTLEKQAKRTKRFYELKNQYKEFSVELASIKLASYKERNDELNKKMQEEGDRLRTLEVQARQLEAAVEKEKKDNLDKEKNLTEKQRALSEVVGNLRGMENDKKMHAQKMDFIQQNHGQYVEQIKNYKGRIEQLDEDVNHYRSELNYNKQSEAELEDELNDAKAQLSDIETSHGSLKSELDAIIESQQTLEKALFELEKQKAVNLNQIDNLRQESERETLDIKEKQEEINHLLVKVQALEETEQGKTGELAGLESDEMLRLKEVKITEEKLEVVRKKIADVNRSLDAKRNEYKLTQSMVENLEGFPESIRFLSKSGAWKQDAQLLSDIIYTDEQYRIAIENYLEPYLNYYVVDNLEEAFAGIKLLGKTQKGKANFFILDAFTNYTAPMRLLPETQMAVNLVKTDGKYQKLVSYLLQNVLVTDNEELVGKLTEDDIVMLSKSGRFIQKRFSVSGGSVGLFEGKKIGRKKNLEVLEEVIRRLEEEENKLSAEMFQLQSKLQKLKGNEMARDIEREREALNKIKHEKVSLQTRMENFQVFVNVASKKHDAARDKVAQLSDEIKGIEEQLASKKIETEQAREKISNTDGSFRMAAEQLSKASSTYNEKNIEFVRHQNKVNTLQRELSFRENQLRDSIEALKQSQTAMTEGEEEMTELQSLLSELEEKLVFLYEEKQTKQAALSEAEQGYFQGRGGINEMEDQLRAAVRGQHEAEMKIAQLKEKFSQMKLELTSTAERLKIEFNIILEDVLGQERQTNFPPDELEAKVSRLKSRLDNYGEINPMALEAFEEMKERYDTIKAQRDDILEAKVSLLETIKEIEDTATTHFMAAFEKVREYFIDVFRTLFSEDDTCDLRLTDPENPLDAGIEIIAKPKGKRPQSINQLSGGEKTLTATALLFSLYLLKPAPFCVFDEVDAPLDDTNIDKFNKIIRKFSKDSQFIIVTHNKQTMAAVDVIYGVYMKEPGVSGVSPVDFRELEHSSTLETVVE